MDRMARVRLPLLLSALLALPATAAGLWLFFDSYRVYDNQFEDEAHLTAWLLGFPLAAVGPALLIVAVVGWRRDSAVMALVSCVIWATLTLLLAYAAGGGVASVAFVVIAVAFTSFGVWAGARVTTQLRYGRGALLPQHICLPRAREDSSDRTADRVLKPQASRHATPVSRP